MPSEPTESNHPLAIGADYIERRIEAGDRPEDITPAKVRAVVYARLVLVYDCADAAAMTDEAIAELFPEPVEHESVEVDPWRKHYVVAWTGGLEQPQYAYEFEQDRAVELAVNWLDEGDAINDSTLQVLEIDPATGVVLVVWEDGEALRDEPGVTQ